MSVDWAYSIATVPTATVRIRGNPPAGVVFRAPITIDAGFNGVNSRVFTGTVQNIDLDGPDVVISCMGNSAALDVPYHKIVKTFVNITNQQALTDLCNDAGLLLYNVNMPTPYWTIGTVVTPTLTFLTYGEAIMKVADPEGGAWFEFPNGSVIIARVDPIPGLTASREYFTKQITGIGSAYPAGVATAITVDGVSLPTLPHIRQLRMQQQIREVKNQIFVRGAVVNYIQGDGTKTGLTLQLDDKAPSTWVLNPDGSQAYNDLLYSHELIDTLPEAANVLTRLLNLLDRLNYKATMTLDFDPDVSLCATYHVEDPDYTGATGNWFVTGYQTSMSETDAVTTVAMIGGSTAGGVGNISPFALFVYNVEREVIGDREWAVVTLNGLLSKDFDGSIAGYTWSDNNGLVSGSTPVIVVRVDPATLATPWNVTLTVTDNLGATGAQTLPIDINIGKTGVAVPGLFVAFRNYASASPDGGKTWYDQAVPVGKTYTAVGAVPKGSWVPGTAVFGTGQGDLYLTTDYCASALTQVFTGAGSPFVHVLADRNNITHLYALTQDGQIYVSLSNGAAGTWNKYDDLKTIFGLPNLRANRIGLPIGAPTGGVWVFGGEGTGLPLIAIDPSRTHAWFKGAIGGELLADLQAAGLIGGGLGTTPSSATYKMLLQTASEGYLLGWTGSAWVQISKDSTTNRGNLKQLGPNLFRMSGFVGDPYQDYTNAAIERSTDGGLTWSVVLNTNIDAGNGYSDIVRTPDGILFATFGKFSSGSGAQQAAIWRSLNEGANWLPVYAYGGTGISATVFGCLAADQNANGKIAALSQDGVLHYTTDGGVTWHTNSGLGAPFATGFSVSSMAFGGSGRIIYEHHDLVGGGFRVTDNLGSSWTDKGGATDLTAITQMTWVSGTTILAAGWKTVAGTRYARVLQSTDNGETWPTILDGQTPIGGLVTNDVFGMGVGADGTIYVHCKTIDTTSRLILARISGVWTNITATAQAITGSETEGERSLAPEVAPISGSSDLFIYEAASREQDELAIILNSSSFSPSAYFTDAINGDGSHWKRAVGAGVTKTHGRYIGPDLEVGKFLLLWDDVNVYVGDVTNGMMTVSLQPGALQAGDAANHGIFIGDYIGGVANTYLIASEGSADGTVNKTWDRGATIAKLRPATGFTAALAGMDAKQMSIGDPSAGAAAVYYVLSNNKLWTYAGNQWNAGVATGHNSSVQLKIAPDGTMYHLDQSTGDMYRSTNSGASWTKIWTATQPWSPNLDYNGVAAYTLDSAGNLYASVGWVGQTMSLYTGNTQNYWPYTIWKSTDKGATWNLLYTGAGVTLPVGGATNCAVMPENIIVSPDGTKIFATSFSKHWGEGGWPSHGYPVGYYSGDSGVTFTARGPDAVISNAGPGFAGWWAFGPSGRVLYFNSSATNVCVFTSDDQAQSWAKRVTLPYSDTYGRSLVTPYAMFLVQDAGGTVTHVFRSSDEGSNWAEITGGPIAGRMDGGMVWDPLANVILMAGSNADLVVITDPTGTPVWTAIARPGASPVVNRWSGGEQVAMA